MKHLRKIMALVLSLAMVLAMSINVFAAEGTATTTPTSGTFTITAPAGAHQYEIYQIFTGDLKDKTLSNIKWGKNGNGTEGNVVDEKILSELKTVAGERLMLL